MNSGNIPLINLIVLELHQREKIGYADAIERLYTSKLFALMQDMHQNTYNTWAAADLVDEMYRIEAIYGKDSKGNCNRHG
ncbi:MAG: hypothetical protein LBG97_03685 [Coriobacteriales bacterium]|jgi:hypothetical protein|nr:hypothetical protein [Coriobacteriales bacterium]